MIRAAAILIILASPAFGQDADPLGQLNEGFLGCLKGAGDVKATTAALATQGWTSDAEAEDGLIYFFPAVGDATFGFMSDDGSFCHIESMTTGTKAAAPVLEAAIKAHGETWVAAKDDMDCARYDLKSGVGATLSSGGQDPVCEMDTDSAVRFAFTE